MVDDIEGKIPLPGEPEYNKAIKEHEANMQKIKANLPSNGTEKISFEEAKSRIEAGSVSEEDWEIYDAGLRTNAREKIEARNAKINRLTSRKTAYHKYPWEK